jgi:magnesium transporter
MAEPAAPILELIAYNREQYFKKDATSADALCSYLREGHVNWINLDGLYNQDAIDAISHHFKLHSLLIEDVVSDQRPKMEEFDNYLFFTMKMLYQIKGPSIDYEQISFVLGKDYLLTFQEKEGDLFEGFRERIRLDQGRVRKKNADYLLYRLIDIVVDNYYNILDHIGDRIDEMEEIIYENTSTASFNKIQGLKKELIYLRKALYPLRDALGKLIKAESDFIQPENIPFYSDVYDHVVHLIDSLDAYQDLSTNLLDIHMNAMSNRMNEVMKVLAVISTIFMPLTFIVGVYGMNFTHMPGLEWKYSYPAIWIVMISVVLGMIGFFRYKKWF